MGYLESFNSSGKKALWFNTLDWKDITQSIIANLAVDSELSAIVNREKVFNGIKQYIFNGLIDGEAYTQKVYIKNLNPGLPAIKQSFIKIDNVWYFSIPLPMLRMILTAFSTEQAKTEFKNVLVDTVYRSVKYKLFKYRMKAVLVQKIDKYEWDETNDREKVITYDSIVKTDPDTDKAQYDKEVEIARKESLFYELDETLEIGKFNTEATVISGLVKIRKFLEKMKTPGYHSKFTRENKNDMFIQKFKSSDFWFLWNTESKIDASAKLAKVYNKDLLKIPGVKSKDYDFQKIEGLTEKEKTSLNGVVGFLIHKDKLKEIIPGEQMTMELPTVKMKKIIEVVTIFGLGHIKLYPIIKVVAK